ncbi:Fujikurins efflux protein [Lachnellula hyalina]|uniref:Fujikurins efflux protein n=1 Tax=Lachnellula hyalina TaxID=1316788 RepID=A0A8H8TX49_9HELO|nr:Fujikurins efflux protein [Lachnellula hyalina]TVY25614.1 Fujikurins efflux protein [Lachnellula hyalina]
MDHKSGQSPHRDSSLSIDQSENSKVDAINDFKPEPEPEMEEETRPDPETVLKREPTGPNPTDFPDGGLQAWLVVVGGFCAVFCGFGWINCIGVFQNYYEHNQLKHYSSSTIAWIPSTQSFMLFFPGFLAGKMTDEMGPRIPILLGSFLHVFGIMMTSLSTEFYQIFLAQAVCSGLGCCFLFYPVIVAAGTWFRRHRALAFGIITAGSSIGGVVLPIMVQRLIPHIGFGWTMRAVGFLFLGLLTIANLTIKSRLPPARRPFNVMEMVKPFTEKPFLLLALGAFFIYVGGFLPFNYIILQGEASGMSTDLASYLVPILNAASTFGRILPAHLGDSFGVFNVMIVLTGFAAIMTLALWLPAAANAPIIVYAVMYGFASGCTLSIIPAMVAKLGHISQLGARSGALYAFSSVGVLIGSPIGGAIQKNQHGGYSGLIIFTGVALLIGTFFAFLSRAAQVGLKIKVRV